MNILYLAHRLPYPPDKGDKIRSFHQIQHLSGHHRLWCACFIDEPADVAHVAALERYCQAVAAIRINPTFAKMRGLVRLSRGGTLTEGFYDNPRMRNTLQAWSAGIDFDAVFVFSSGMAPYARPFRQARRVIDLCDWDSAKWNAYGRRRTPLAPLYRLEARRLARREAAWTRSFHAAVVITQAEADDAPPGALTDRIHVVCNGVTKWPYQPPPAQPRVGFLGAMDYPPNIDAVCFFARQVWPHITRAAPQATFHIGGRNPTARVRRLGRLPGIEVLGQVPDANAAINDVAVSVAPLRIARGLQNKVLEAMAAGRPVVLTTPAAQGIGAKNGREFLVADDPLEMAAQATDLLTHPRQAADMGQAARRFVGQNFDWSHEMAKLDRLLAGSAAPRPAPPPFQAVTV
ncbi:MAG: TIGR03087 family PEP-CTERM/XrtA system glycosyltransferase [Phycisphaerae bacterium]